MTDEFIPAASPENPVQVYRPHVFSLLVPTLWSLLMLLPIFLIALALTNMGIVSQPVMIAGQWLFGGLYLVFVVSYFMMNVIFWYMDAWLITSTGLVDVQLVALFDRRIAQIAWNQVQDVRVTTEGLLASLFGYGNITVQSAGKQGVFEMRSIPSARAVAELISELSNSARTGISKAGPERFPTERLGEILIEQRGITDNQLTLALQEQRQTGERLGEIMVRHGFIGREDLVKALGHQYHIPHIDLSRYELDPSVVKLMSYNTAVKYHAIPIHRSADNVINIAISEPSHENMGELMEQFDVPLTFLVADESYIREAINGHYLVHRDGAAPNPVTPPTPDNNLPEESE